MKGSRNRATVKIKHRKMRRPGIRDISTVAVWRHVDEERFSVDADCGDNFILLRVNHADVRGAGVNNVNFISLRISRHPSGLVAHLQSSHRTKTTQVDDSNGVALAIADVCKFTIERSVGGESALVKVIPAGGGQQRDKDGEEEEFSQGWVGLAEGKRFSDAAPLQSTTRPRHTPL